MNWSLQKHTAADKSFQIYGPEDIILTVDFDDVQHSEVDRIAQRIVRTLNEHYRTESLNNSDKAYWEQERIKGQGWKAFNDESKTLDERKTGLLLVIESHFNRSLQSWRACGKRESTHGTFPQFVAAWLVANNGLVPAQEILASLRNEFPHPKGLCHIGPGQSYWR